MAQMLIPENADELLDDLIRLFRSLGSTCEEWLQLGADPDYAGTVLSDISDLRANISYQLYRWVDLDPQQWTISVSKNGGDYHILATPKGNNSDHKSQAIGVPSELCESINDLEKSPPPVKAASLSGFTGAVFYAIDVLQDLRRRLQVSGLISAGPQPNSEAASESAEDTVPIHTLGPVNNEEKRYRVLFYGREVEFARQPFIFFLTLAVYCKLQINDGKVPRKQLELISSRVSQTTTSINETLKAAKGDYSREFIVSKAKKLYLQFSPHEVIIDLAPLKSSVNLNIRKLAKLLQLKR